jgi:hypothetical protein
MIDILDFRFNAKLLAEDLARVKAGVRLSGGNQLSLVNTTDNEDLHEGTGSYVTPNGRIDPSSFNRLIQRIKGTYTESVIRQLGWRTGRIRYMFLKPKACYSMHSDGELYRYHIPIITNDQSYMVYEKEGCFRMPETGRMYRTRVDARHSAINGHNHDTRVHLLFDHLPESLGVIGERWVRIT